MRRCKHCGLMPKFRETEATTANIKLFIWECPKQCHYLSSELSKTNARKLWDKHNTITKEDMYNDLKTAILFFCKVEWFNKDCLPEIVKIVNKYRDKV